MENQNCFKCGRENTKYSCITCVRKICNVCSESCLPSEPGYSEENYMIGKCSDCINGPGEEVEEEVVISKSKTSTFKKKQGKQLTLNFFAKSSSTKKKIGANEDNGGPTSSEEKSKNTESISTLNEEKSIVKTATANADMKDEKNTCTRNLTKLAAEKWKSTHLVNLDANEWLVVNADKKGNVQSLNCKVCKNYAPQIENMKNFSSRWAYEGSTTLQVSNAKKHAGGDPHQEAMRLHNKNSGKDAEEVAAKVRDDERQSKIQSGISKMQHDDLERMKKKFDLAYFIAKEELPLSKYESLIQLEKKHGVDLGEAYLNEMQCATFIESISDTMSESLKDRLTNVNFFSVLTDGTTDAAVVEKEAVFVRYVNPCPPMDKTVKICTSFVNIASLKTGKADGILDAVQTSFKEIGVSNEDLIKKLVAFGADGTNSNSGETGGAIAVLKETFGEWIIFVWCVSHRLELGIKDALMGTVFDDIDELLLNVYLLYRKSPKKLRELQAIHDSFKETFEFEVGSVKPKRASGTRWVAHKINAMIVLLDKYGIFIQHLERMSVDKTYKANERAKFLGYLRKWKHARYPVLLCLFIELLSPVKVLSLAFQDEDVDIVNVVSSIEKTKKQLDKLIEHEFSEYPTFIRFKSKLSVEDGKVLYQDTILNCIEDAENHTAAKKNQLTGLIRDFVMKRLEANEIDTLKSATVLLNTEAWRKDDEFGNDDLRQIFEHFSVPLQQAGVEGSIEDVLEEWRELVDYAVSYLNVENVSYPQLWYKIFNSSRKTKWHRILLIAELLFSLPISNAVVERLFSLFKRIKTRQRCSLGNVRTSQLLRTCLEGPPVEEFDATKYVETWFKKSIRRPKQGKRKQYVRSKAPTKKAKVLVDMSSSESSDSNSSYDDDSEEDSMISDL